MKRVRTEYTPQFVASPMTFWVHGGSRPDDACTPPLPQPVPGAGYARYFVEFDGFEFEFASLAELDTCIDVLGKRLLPQSRTLGSERGAGPNAHWLSRLPAKVKPWGYRERAVRFLRRAREQLKMEAG